MARFNKNATVKSSKSSESENNDLRSRPDATQNLAGGLAFEKSPKMRLVSYVATSFMSDKFYESDADARSRIVNDIQSVAKEDPKFILQLARYARTELNMRSAPIMLLAEASLIDECKPVVEEYTPLIIQRPDDMTETIAYINSKIGDIGSGHNERVENAKGEKTWKFIPAKKGSLPAALKRGLATSFKTFNEYQLAKWNKSSGSVKLRDVMRIVRPKPRDEEQAALFGRLVRGELAIPQTWEVMFGADSKGSGKRMWQELGYESEKAAWEAIQPKMGLMATVRNLRNMLQAGVDMAPVIEKLKSKEQVHKSKMLPFRFLEAHRIVKTQDGRNTQVSKVIDALEEAMETSLDNLPKLAGVTAIAADQSGSMDGRISDYSQVSIKDIANSLMAISHKMCESAVVIPFADHAKTVNLSSRAGVFTNIEKVENTEVGGSTNTWKAVRLLRENRTKVDRIIILSDEQGYFDNEYDSGTETSVAEEVRAYRKEVNPNVYVISIDLAGHAAAQFPEGEPRTALVSGWSENVLKFIAMFETDSKTVIDEIKEKW